MKFNELLNELSNINIKIENDALVNLLTAIYTFENDMNVYGKLNLGGGSSNSIGKINKYIDKSVDDLDLPSDSFRVNIPEDSFLTNMTLMEFTPENQAQWVTSNYGLTMDVTNGICKNQYNYPQNEYIFKAKVGYQSNFSGTSVNNFLNYRNKIDENDISRDNKYRKLLINSLSDLDLINEIIVGSYNGKNIYQKTFFIPNTSFNSYYPLGIDSIDEIIDEEWAINLSQASTGALKKVYKSDSYNYYTKATPSVYINTGTSVIPAPISGETMVAILTVSYTKVVDNAPKLIDTISALYKYRLTDMSYFKSKSFDIFKNNMIIEFNEEKLIGSYDGNDLYSFHIDAPIYGNIYDMPIFTNIFDTQVIVSDVPVTDNVYVHNNFASFDLFGGSGKSTLYFNQSVLPTFSYKQKIIYMK